MGANSTADIPYLPSNGGRPSIDWHMLFQMWIRTKDTKREFLTKYGLGNSGTVKRRTKEWTKNKADAVRNMKERLNEQDDPRISNLYKTIQQWRNGQAENDYNIGEAIKTHIKMLLNVAIGRNEDGTPYSTLKPNDVRALAHAASETQRIQRLALGMSTDNVGVDFPEPDSNVDKTQVEEFAGPVFEVLVNEAGKFKSARPKQIA